MFPPTIRGWSMAARSLHGRAGIHIREFGLAGRTSPSASASESDGSADSDGAGAIGVLIGTAATRSITAGAITHEAVPFTTAVLSIVAALAADSAPEAQGLSMETAALPEATRHPAAREASVPVRLADTTGAGKHVASHRAAAPALAAEDSTAAAVVVDVIDS